LSDAYSGQRRGGATAFQAFGRTLHLRIRSAADLAAAASLDEAHWVATSAPVASFHGDGEWLRLIDADGDGKITCRELRQAIHWLLEVLEDHAGIDAASETLDLSAVSTASPEGGRILEAAGKVLERVGRAGSDRAGRFNDRKSHRLPRRRRRAVPPAGPSTPACASPIGWRTSLPTAPPTRGARGGCGHIVGAG
jgi:hypothetical protein